MVSNFLRFFFSLSCWDLEPTVRKKIFLHLCVKSVPAVFVIEGHTEQRGQLRLHIKSGNCSHLCRLVGYTCSMTESAVRLMCVQWKSRKHTLWILNRNYYSQQTTLSLVHTQLSHTLVQPPPCVMTCTRELVSGVLSLLTSVHSVASKLGGLGRVYGKMF